MREMKDLNKTKYLKKFEELVYDNSDFVEFMTKAAEILYKAVMAEELEGGARIGDWALYGKLKNICGVKYVVLTLRYEADITLFMEYDEEEYRANIIEYDEYMNIVGDVTLEDYIPGYKPRKIINNI